MVMGRKEIGAALLAGLAIFVVWNTFFREEDVVQRAALRLDAGSDIPAIDLARLQEPPRDGAAPLRDIFKYGRDSAVDLDPVPIRVVDLAPKPSPTPFPLPEPEPTPTPWPQLNVALIGIIDNGAGRKIGSFVKDGEVVLVGQPGQVLGNAFRVVRIGTESAEIEELGSGRTRRLPLKTNQ
jgi:hypothetical protein